MFTLNSDGGARGNPGLAAIGAVIKNEQGEVVFAGGLALGSTTNNFAEYQALLFGLMKAIELGIKDIECLLDSELVVKQLKGEYKVKDIHLKELHSKVLVLKSKFSQIVFSNIPRAKNKGADKIVNNVLDGKSV